MKVLYLASDGDVQLHGHEGCSVHIREFTSALVEAGHQVTIICAWAGDPGSLRLDSRVHHLEAEGLDADLWRSLETEPLIQDHHLERDLRSVLWNYWLQIRGAEIIEREQPDFIYERCALFGFGGAQLSRRHGLPLILELNAPLCDQQAGYEKFTLTRTAAALESLIIAQAHGIVALTPWLRDWAVTRGADPGKIQVLPDGVSESLFAAPPDGEAVRNRHGLDGKRVVGFVGSFHWWHDVATLLRAFHALQAEDPELRLLLVGEGETRKKIAREAGKLGLGDRVIFTGKVPHQEVPQHLAAMDVTVVPYVALEKFFFSPMKLFESMAAGRPTVAAALGQIEEVIDHGKTGWLYPAGDARRLAEGISMLLGNQALARKIAEAGRQEVLRNYTWKIVAEKVIEMVRRVSDQRAGRSIGSARS